VSPNSLVSSSSPVVGVELRHQAGADRPVCGLSAGGSNVVCVQLVLLDQVIVLPLIVPVTDQALAVIVRLFRLSWAEVASPHSLTRVSSRPDCRISVHSPLIRYAPETSAGVGDGGGRERTNWCCWPS